MVLDFLHEQEKVTGLVEDMLLDFLQTAGKNNRGLSKGYGDGGVIGCLTFCKQQEKITGD